MQTFAAKVSLTNKEGGSEMATHTDPAKAPDTKPGAKPVGKDDLQTLPLQKSRSA